MSALRLFDGEHHETSQHNITRRMRRTKRREVDGTLKVECVIEEVEIRRNVKHLTMNQSKAADQFQTNGGSLSKPLKKRFCSKIVLDDECTESDQDYFGGPDLIDLINSPHSRHDRWTKNCESPNLGSNGDSSPVMHSLVLLSDGDESDAACSDAESAEIILGSESEDDGRLNLSMSQYPGPNVSPELSTTPLSLVLTLSKSQEPSASSGAEGDLKFMSGSSREDSALIGRGEEPPIAIGSGDEDFGDGNVSDSCCSIASGPSQPRQPAPQGPCSSCLALCVRMRRLTNWTKSRVKDPACLYYDQWMLLKPWRPRGVRGLRRVRGKLFVHLPRIRQHAKVRAEEDLDNEWEVCTRPHVFLQRNLRQCQRSQPNPLNRTKVRNKAGSRRGRRSKDAWPPVGGQNVKRRRRRRSKNMEDSLKTKKKKTSAGEKQRSGGRGEETSGTEERHEDSQPLGDEHSIYNDVTADCSTEERANLSPDRRQGMNADIQTNGCPDEHGNVNAPSPSEWPVDANVGSTSRRRTDRYTGSGPDCREDSPGDLRADGHRDGHREKQRSNQRSVGKANGHTGVKAFKCVVGGSDRDARRSTDRYPVVRLYGCDGVNGNVKQADRLQKAPHNSREVEHEGACKHSRWSTDRPTGSDADVSLKRNADDQGSCLNDERRQRKSPPRDALSRHLGVDPNIHLNSPSSMNGDEVLDDSDGHLDINVEDSSDELEDSSADAGLTRRALLFEDPPTLPLASASTATPAVGPVRTRRHTPSKEPYAFRTPTPPGIEGSESEVLRKPRPFVRTYESTGAPYDSFKSMLCTLNKMRGAVVNETDP